MPGYKLFAFHPDAWYMVLVQYSRTAVRASETIPDRVAAARSARYDFTRFEDNQLNHRGDRLSTVDAAVCAIGKK